ncbi:cytoskeleton-associated protein 2 [Pleuronectes platessa]|uniref:cytoskeleton-associated protein 2 n=1 Tax=Pleuronectes platessa TaxID=8262 RepID=UPI00232A2382|nr:cytoskeleton-associated protein 2 [Pleuronectes platessa]XP_053297220.1 cytoskeleton-associated protein 2 [Pleuronectes platessa]
MDTVAVSSRNCGNKGNKENTQPAHGSKSLIQKKPVAPFHVKSNEKEETSAKHGPLKPKPKLMDRRSTYGDALKKTKTAQKDGKPAAASDVARRQTLSRAFLTEQAVKHQKIVAEVPKRPAAALSSRSALGMYKGKMVESKIGSIWKSTASLDSADLKPVASKTERHSVQNVKKVRSQSVSDLPKPGTKKPAPTVSKSAFNRPAQVSRPAVTSRPPTGFYSARPSTRTVPATKSRNPAMTATKGSGSLSSKPKIPVKDKVNKPSAASTLSQFRLTAETAEEKRAKLAEWLASKGKTSKRPAMTTAAPPKTNAFKPGTNLKSQSRAEPRPVAHKPDTQEAALPPRNQTPRILNTTLELLESSDEDLSVDPQESVDDIVVNLCDVLEAMATPSRCSESEYSQVTEECHDVTEDVKMKDECDEEEVKNEAEERDEQKIETDEEELERDDDVVETTPPMGDASVVKYSVKTTPYLQSVKRTIEGDVSSSRRKSNIKDLKFLTPVRRSTRINRQCSRLPTMLADHDPCVSSLAELVKLDDDPNAYIYRRNPALLDDLPDQPRL